VPPEAAATAGREWRSRDDGFGVVIGEHEASQLFCYCQAAGDNETGGILIGHYNDQLDRALVTKVTGPPGDSRAGRAFFVRGTRGLQRLINRLWRSKSSYYLGEWHFHPQGDGTPSGVDRDQMERIAKSPAYLCPEPILLIVANQPGASWAIRAFVYPDGRQIELQAI